MRSLHHTSEYAYPNPTADLAIRRVEARPDEHLRRLARRLREERLPRTLERRIIGEAVAWALETADRG